MSERVKITIRCVGGNGQYELLHDTGKTLLETMREGAVPLPSFCGGMGKCGRCMVRFCGYAPLPAQTDRSFIDPDRLREGFRLACTARPRQECVAEADFAGERAAEEERLQVVTEYYAADRMGQDEANPDKMRRRGKNTSGNTLAAADIGTTTIAMQLLEISSGRILDTYTCLNPQRSYGMDVISRIRAADDGQGGTLQKLLWDALASGLGQFKQSAGKQGMCGPELLSIACNTAMGHIFMGYPTKMLGKSPFLPVNIKTVSIKLEGMDVAVMPGISAFVGGDIVAGLYACGLCQPVLNGEEGEAWLFMDLGTNAEMVMGDGHRMAATAAAAGPAFEGKGKDGAAGTERIRAVADLLERGIADETGLLEEPYFGTGIEVEIFNRLGKEKESEGQPGREKEPEGWLERKKEPEGRQEREKESGGRQEKEKGRGGIAGESRLQEKGQLVERQIVYVSQEDIRDIQMAKAAIRSGIHFLMERLGIRNYGRIKKVYLAGGMGFYLDRKAAVKIGLLPGELAEKMETVGNAALAGAGLFGRKGWQECGRELENYASRIEVFHMAEFTEFEDVYIGYMNFSKNRA